jgi:hypothetical protein
MKKIDCKNFIHTGGHSVACTHVVWFMSVTVVACASWLLKIFTYLHAHDADWMAF